MEVIVSHQNTDFDSLASMVAAQKLYPKAPIVFSGSKEKNVREFLDLHPSFFHVRRLKELDLSNLERLIIVDTRQRDRIGQLSHIVAERQNVELHIFDHHPVHESDLSGKINEIRDIGATTTIMLAHIKSRKLEISPQEATLFALGIYEDTGCLTYPSTRPEDVEAVAYLLKNGANLDTVTNFINRELTSEQLAILNELMSSSENYDINGVRVVIAKASYDKYVADLAVLTHKLRDMGNLEVIFTLVQMHERIHLVGRSKVESVDVGSLAEYFGGGGHTTAASAMIRNSTLEEIEEILLSLLDKYIKPVIKAKDIMSSPVITINYNSTVEEARRKVLSHNHTGFPVVKNDKLVGLITHKDIYKTINHGLGGDKVIGYMHPDVTVLNPSVGLNEVQKIMIESHIKYLPVVDNDKLVGILTYTDVLKSHHSRNKVRVPRNADADFRYHTKNVTSLLENRLTPDILRLIKKMGKIADEMRYNAFLVGGLVRDLLIGVDNLDIDIVVEGLGVQFARELVKKLGGRYIAHKKFATAIVVLPNGFKIDIATARTEYYEFPTALPTVELSSIRYDLYRRDFTINALAVNINPSEFGALVDFFQGRQDIKRGIIKVLHNLSFVDDPTRIFRAVRFESRFGFKIDKQTEHFIDNALQLGVLEKINNQRIREEIILLLSEGDPWVGIARLGALNVLKKIHPKMKADLKARHLFEQVKEVLAWFNLLYLKDKVHRWLIYFMALTNRLDAAELNDFAREIRLNKKHFQVLQTLHEKKVMIHQKLNARQALRDSEIYQTLSHIPLEILLFIMSDTKNENIKKRISRYITDLRKVRISLTGRDLAQIGIPQGPQYSALLETVILGKLDGEIKSKDDEIAMVKSYYAGRKKTSIS